MKIYKNDSIQDNDKQHGKNAPSAEFAKDFSQSDDIVTFKQSIINRITHLSNQSGLTISRLAIKSGMPPATLYDIVQTKNTKLPNLLTVKRLCETFNITLSQFFDTEEINNSPTD